MFASVVDEKQFIVGITSGLVCSFLLALWKRNKSCQTLVDSTKVTKKKKKNTDLKMVIVVRKDMKLTKRELAVQCVHACIQAFKESTVKNPDYVKRWYRWGGKKVAVKVNSEAELLAIKRDADKNNLVCYVSRDSDPSKNNAFTLAIGPDSSDDINAITGHLKLL